MSPASASSTSRHRRSRSRSSRAGGRGIGSELLDALIELAKEQGRGGLSLSVADDSPAMHVFEKQGFEKVEQTDGSWTMRLNLPTARSSPIRIGSLGPRAALHTRVVPRTWLAATWSQEGVLMCADR